MTTSGAAADTIALGGAAVTNFTFNNTASVTVFGAAMAAGKVDTVVAQGSGAFDPGRHDEVFGIGAGAANNLASITSTVPGPVWATINGDTTTFKGGSGGGNILSVYETTGGRRQPLRWWSGRQQHGPDHQRRRDLQHDSRSGVDA